MKSKKKKFYINNIIYFFKIRSKQLHKDYFSTLKDELKKMNSLKTLNLRVSFDINNEDLLNLAKTISKVLVSDI